MHFFYVSGLLSLIFFKLIERALFSMVLIFTQHIVCFVLDVPYMLCYKNACSYGPDMVLDICRLEKGKYYLYIISSLR